MQLLKKDKVFQAIEFAAKAHSGQYRKGTRIPYITHPINVGTILLRAGASTEMTIAAILHDTVEDTRVTFEGIKRKFGPEVERIVRKATEKNKFMHSWKERKSSHVKHIPGLLEDEAAVICADKLDNITSIETDLEHAGSVEAKAAVFNRFKAPVSEISWYYHSLSEAFAGYPFKNEAYRQIAFRLKNAVNRVFPSK